MLWDTRVNWAYSLMLYSILLLQTWGRMVLTMQAIGLSSAKFQQLSYS